MARFNLFKPKLTHSDWVVRRRAVESLTDDATLAQVAKTDSDEHVRLAAVKKVREEATLAEVVRTDSDERVRLAAVDKVRDEATLAEAARTDSDIAVRLAAVERVRDEATLAQVAKTDTDGFVRLAAVEKLKDQDTLADVARLDSDGNVRFAAVERLTDGARLAEVARAAGSESYLRKAAVERLRDGAALADVVRSDPDHHVRQAAVERLTEEAVLTNVVTALGTARTIELLTSTLAEEDRHVRWLATTALEKIDDEWPHTDGARAAVPTLIAALKDADYSFLERNDVAKVLGEIGDRRAIESLVVIRYTELFCRDEATDALEKIDPNWRHSEGARAAIPQLVAAAQSGDGDAIEGLGEIAGEAAAEALTPLLSDPHSYLRKRAADTLASLGWEPANDIHRAWLAAIKEEWDVLASTGAAAVAPLVTLLQVGEIGYRDNTPATRKYYRSAVRTLCEVLTASASRVDQEDLLRAVALQDIRVFGIGNVRHWTDDDLDPGHDVVEERPVDCSQARALAREELVRRGIDPSAGTAPDD